MTEFVVVIPARYASERLPGKPLRDINGQPMIAHVHARATESAAREIVIATDDERIAETAEDFGATVCMTGSTHRSGSERIAEVCEVFDWDDDVIVVNLQGDEPTMPAALIDQCAELLAGCSADIATLASPLRSADELNNPNVVKVVTNNDAQALYFSRAPIPYPRASMDDAVNAAAHHHGIYAYRCGILRQLVAAAPTDIERIEQLEQLRALSLGMQIQVGQPAVAPGAGVDTEDDLIAAAAALASSQAGR